MKTTQFNFFLNRYKGKYIRLYLKGDSYCHGLLVSGWRECYIMMVSVHGALQFRYVKFDQIQYIYPYRCLSAKSPSLVYSSQN